MCQILQIHDQYSNQYWPVVIAPDSLKKTLHFANFLDQKQLYKLFETLSTKSPSPFSFLKILQMLY